jgi:hypothetical protein
MDIKRAREINKICCDWYMFGIGVDDREPPGDALEGVSLKEMIEAKELVQEANKEAAVKDGSRTISCVCDDRFLAALYTAHNYTGNLAKACEPVAGSSKNAVVVVLRSEFTD